MKDMIREALELGLTLAEGSHHKQLFREALAALPSRGEAEVVEQAERWEKEWCKNCGGMAEAPQPQAEAGVEYIYTDKEIDEIEAASQAAGAGSYVPGISDIRRGAEPWVWRLDYAATLPDSQIIEGIESEASWFLLDQSGRVWEYGPMTAPHLLDKAYTRAIPLFRVGAEYLSMDAIIDRLSASKPEGALELVSPTEVDVALEIADGTRGPQGDDDDMGACLDILGREVKRLRALTGYGLAKSDEVARK